MQRLAPMRASTSAPGSTSCSRPSFSRITINCNVSQVAAAPRHNRPSSLRQRSDRGFAHIARKGLGAVVPAHESPCLPSTPQSFVRVPRTGRRRGRASHHYGCEREHENAHEDSKNKACTKRAALCCDDVVAELGVRSKCGAPVCARAHRQTVTQVQHIGAEVCVCVCVCVCVFCACVYVCYVRVRVCVCV